MNMSKESHLTDEQIAGLVRELIETGKIDEGLYNLLCAQGFLILEKRLFGADKGKTREEAHSLALDFLLHVRNKRLNHLRSAAHIARKLSKYLTRRESPAYHEVWKALSQSLLGLEKNGLVERQSDAGNTNSQATEWCLKGCINNPATNVQEFFEKAAGLSVYHPSRKDGRLLAPSQAKDLTLRMLELADGPILMQDLHSEAMKHVVHTMAYAESLDGEPGDGGDESAPVPRTLADRMPIIGYILEEEAAERADKIWRELEKSGDGKVLCVYYLPKHLLGKPVTGGEIGDPRRISEAGKRIREAFQKAIDLTPTLNERQEAATMDRRDPSGGGVAGPQAQLLGRIAEILIEYCSEKSWDINLKPRQDEP